MTDNEAEKKYTTIYLTDEPEAMCKTDGDPPAIFALLMEATFRNFDYAKTPVPMRLGLIAKAVVAWEQTRSARGETPANIDDLINELHSDREAPPRSEFFKSVKF